MRGGGVESEDRGDQDGTPTQRSSWMLRLRLRLDGIRKECNEWCEVWSGIRSWEVDVDIQIITVCSSGRGPSVLRV